MLWEDSRHFPICDFGLFVIVDTSEKSLGTPQGTDQTKSKVARRVVESASQYGSPLLSEIVTGQ